ncbi:MAG: type II toxin-antitoxin system Phd/YefM family antitoxin [Ardenticatenaceae bacterium]|nr:type II toxin-antitoxin system Phd/YefM family antitoxin [Ardenticatenaceae bacterium]
MTTYSIAEARDRFAALVRDAEETKQPVQVTRRGQTVAVILSVEEYDRLLSQQPKQNFWEAYLAYKEQWQDVLMDIDDDIWEDVRDRTPPSEVNPWL